MPDDRIRVCPACDSTRWRVRNDRHGTATGAERYTCSDCGERFDVPAERPPKVPGASRWGTKRRVSDDAIDAARRALGIEVNE